MTERELVLSGFHPRGDGTLHSPGHVTIAPTGEFYRLTIALPNGEILSCHVSKLALKICKEVKT